MARRVSVKKIRGARNAAAKRGQRMKKKKRALRRATRKRVDRLQNSVLKDLQKQVKAVANRPEVRYHDQSQSTAVTIPAAASGMPSTQFYRITPVHDNIAPDGALTTSDDISQLRFTGQDIHPISQYWRCTLINGGTAAEDVRVWFMQVDCSKIPNDKMNDGTEWEAINNPANLYQGTATTAADFLDLQKLLFRYRGTETTENAADKWKFAALKILAVRDYHLPGNNNGHRPHTLQFSFSHIYAENERWVYPANKEIKSTADMALNKGKIVVAAMTSRNGNAKIVWKGRFKFTD